MERRSRLGRRTRLATADAGTRHLRTRRRTRYHGFTSARPRPSPTGIGLFPEQIWDMPDIPEEHMFFGKATGAAIPLLWAHAEYVRLLRSMVDKKIFDRIDPVFERYCNDNPRRVIEIWKVNRQVQKVPAGALLRMAASSPFVLHWTDDEWTTPATPNRRRLPSASGGITSDEVVDEATTELPTFSASVAAGFVHRGWGVPGAVSVRHRSR